MQPLWMTRKLRTRMPSKSARAKCSRHIPSDWVSRLTSQSSTTRSWTLPTKPASWPNRLIRLQMHRRGVGSGRRESIAAIIDTDWFFGAFVGCNILICGWLLIRHFHLFSSLFLFTCAVCVCGGGDGGRWVDSRNWGLAKVVPRGIRYSAGKDAANAPDPFGPRAQLLRVLLRDYQFASTCLSSGQTGAPPRVGLNCVYRVVVLDARLCPWSRDLPLRVIVDCLVRSLASHPLIDPTKPQGTHDLWNVCPVITSNQIVCVFKLTKWYSGSPSDFFRIP